MNACRHCGLPEEEHHTYEPRKAAPPGCKCDDGTWGDLILPVCGEYIGNGRQYCRTCEHDAECHEVKP